MRKTLLILLCIPLIGFGKKIGCTDPSSFKYDSNATVDDGTCVYHYLDVYFSDDSNTVYFDSSRTKRITGHIEYFNKLNRSTKKVVNGKTTDEITLKEWLIDPYAEDFFGPLGPGVVFFMILFFLAVILIFIAVYRVIKYFLPKNYVIPLSISIFILLYSGFFIELSILIILIWIYLGIKKRKKIDCE